MTALTNCGAMTAFGTGKLLVDEHLVNHLAVALVASLCFFLVCAGIGRLRK